MNIQDVLDCPMQENDSGASTIKGYLKALLYAVWDENEGFSGKRPFGNSGWENDIVMALVEKELITGSVNQYGDLTGADYPAMNKLIFEAIEAL